MRLSKVVSTPSTPRVNGEEGGAKDIHDGPILAWLHSTFPQYACPLQILRCGDLRPLSVLEPRELASTEHFLVFLEKRRQSPHKHRMYAPYTVRSMIERRKIVVGDADRKLLQDTVPLSFPHVESRRLGQRYMAGGQNNLILHTVAFGRVHLGGGIFCGKRPSCLSLLYSGGVTGTASTSFQS